MRLAASRLMWVLAPALASMMVMWVVGCGDSQRSVCIDTCAREANCADELSLKSDKSECTELCQQLEREPGGEEMVAAHAACVAEAKTCRDVLACR